MNQDIIAKRVQAAIAGDPYEREDVVPDTLEPAVAPTEGMAAIDEMRNQARRDAIRERAEEFAEESTARGTASRIAIALREIGE